MGDRSVRLLADTEAVVRFAIDDLPVTARQALSEAQNDVFVSAASVWEIATKVRIGKLSLPDSLLTRGLARWLVEEGYALLPIGADHAEQAGSMASEHRDPWDRMILAQAQIEDLVIVGSDAFFARHAPRTIWR